MARAIRQMDFILNTKASNQANSSEFGTHRIGVQRRLRRACANAQSRQDLHCSYIINRDDLINFIFHFSSQKAVCGQPWRNDILRRLIKQRREVLNLKTSDRHCTFML